MIIKTSRIPHDFDAVTVWPFIFVRPAYADNAALIAHEQVHYNEQAWVTPLWWLRYGLSKKFRLAAEVRAYKVQIAMGGISRTAAAQKLVLYRLDITMERALEALAQTNPS